VAARRVAAQVVKGYYVIDEILYFEDSVGRQQVVAPTQLRKKLLLENHHAVFAGHFLPKNLVQWVSQYYYWPGMKS